MDSDKGFIKLSRSFFDNKIWQAARAFSECEAWLDLIQSARFEASPTTSRIGCYEVTWGKGQYPASNRFLAKKWGRSEQWVKSFLGRLKRESMITTDNGQGMNVITLVNFEKYNGGMVGNTSNNPPCNPLNVLYDNGLKKEVTHLVTHPVTHLAQNDEKQQPTSNPNTKKEEEYIRESTNVDILSHPTAKQIFGEPMQCQCISHSTGEQCKRKALYDVDGKLYCNQHSKSIIGDILKNISANSGFSKDATYIKSDYEKFNDWMKDNTPNVLKLEKQMTEEQFLKLKKVYDTDKMIDILFKMDNYKALTRKYVSVYLTFINWAKREYEN